MWKNKKEEIKFTKQFEKDKQQYLLLGMTSEKIDEIYNFEKQNYLSNRRFYTHLADNTKIDVDDHSSEILLIQYNDEYYDEYKCESDPLLDGINDERLIKIINNATPTERIVLTYLKNGYSKSDIAGILGVSRPYISKLIKNFRNF